MSAETVEVGARVFQAVSLLVGLSTLALSARVLRLLRVAIRKLRDRADLEARISAAAAVDTEGERVAVLPRAPRS